MLITWSLLMTTPTPTPPPRGYDLGVTWFGPSSYSIPPSFVFGRFIYLFLFLFSGMPLQVGSNINLPYTPCGKCCIQLPCINFSSTITSECATQQLNTFQFALFSTFSTRDLMPMADILFTAVETMNAPRCWGRFLDSGTGVHSVKWIQKLPTTEWVAITADNNMKAQITNDKDVQMR